MIHYYFGDKLGLYRAMIESAVQPLIDSVRRLGRPLATRRPDLEAVMRAYMRMVAANPWFPALLIREVLDQNGRMRGEFIERFAGRTAPALVAVLRREREQGKLRARPRSTVCRGLAAEPLRLSVLSLPITGPVLGFRPEGDELDRFISHTAHCSAKASRRARRRDMTRFESPARTVHAAARCRLREGAPVEVHGTVERDRLEIIAESNERIVEIAVHEGDRVQAGTVLVRQEAGIAQPRIDQSRAALLEAQRRLADLEQGPRQREIDEARAALGGAESEIADGAE